MRYTKRIAGFVMAAGMLIGAGTLSAAERRDDYGDRARVNQEVRYERGVVPARPVRVVESCQRVVRHDRRDHRRYDRDWR